MYMWASFVDISTVRIVYSSVSKVGGREGGGGGGGWYFPQLHVHVL